MTVGGSRPGRGRPDVRGVRNYRVGTTDIRSASYRPRGRSSGTLRGLLFLILLAAVVLVGAFIVAGPALRDFARGLARDNPQTMRWPFVSDIVRADLGAALTDPAGADATPIEFTIAEGTSVFRIGQNLASQELISDPLVFQYLVISRNLESGLQTGTFTLNETMTPGAIVDRLQRPPDPPPALITIAIRSGLRIEQITAQLQDQLPGEIDPQEFHDLATEPPASLRADYPWMDVIPEGRSLEGFLASGVFEMDAAVDADGFLRALLDEWQATIGEPYIPIAEAQGRNFYEVITLASIVEKEATLDEERPLIAGVYQNRLSGLLNGNELLNADPTVIYANDTMQLRQLDLEQWPAYAFWGLIGVPSLNDFTVSQDLQGYQSYQVQGLPPGPIASPATPSVEAALNPETESGNLFFVACGEGTHRFATNIGEHNANVAECQA